MPHTVIATKEKHSNKTSLKGMLDHTEKEVFAKTFSLGPLQISLIQRNESKIKGSRSEHRIQSAEILFNHIAKS